MSGFVLDTDTLSLYQRGHPAVCRRCGGPPAGGLFITIITVEEQLSGWYSLLRRAKGRSDLARIYGNLAETIGFLAPLPILSFTEPAIDRFHELVALRLNVGMMDLRIAAIVLEHSGTLVTRNARDFRRIPGLVIQDWTSENGAP